MVCMPVVVLQESSHTSGPDNVETQAWDSSAWSATRKEKKKMR